MRTYLIFACIVALAACIVTFNYFRKQPDIPEKVSISFLEKFPSEKYPVWIQEGDRYKAAFDISGRERIALFHADGRLLSYTEEIEKRHLPATILQVVEEQFTDFKIDDTFRFHENGTISYLIELENGNKELKVQLDSNGQLLKQQPVAAPVVNKTATAATVNMTSAAPNPVLHLGKPALSWELPSDLLEVSGISMLPDGKMACIQDEAGLVFIYDLATKTITHKIPFAGKGDYEGLEVAGNTIYVLRSDGVLFEISDYRAAKPAVTQYASGFAGNMDNEGLAYDKANNRLLFTGKGVDAKLPDAKGIYAFSITDKTFRETPVISIPLQQQELAGKVKKGKKSADQLQPSSLTIHPQTGELYLLDAKNYLLLVINEQGQVQKKTILPKQPFRQAEGICFGSNGEMYISSEGKKGGKGIIAQYAVAP